MNILAIHDSWQPALRQSLGSFSYPVTVISYHRGVWTHQTSQDRTSDPAVACAWARLFHNGCPIVIWEHATQKEFTTLYQRALGSQPGTLPRLVVVLAPWVKESGPEERKILSLASLEDPEDYLIASFSRTLLEYPM